jgi:hypothetical protein
MVFVLISLIIINNFWLQKKKTIYFNARAKEKNIQTMQKVRLDLNR